MLIELNRFTTTDDVRVAYGLPDELLDQVLPLLPVAYKSPDGTCYHLESELDQYFAEFVRRQRYSDANKELSLTGTPGRKTVTLEIALFAQQLKQEKFTWKEIWKQCKARWPSDDRVRNKEQVRGTWTRFFGPRAKKTN